MEATDIVVVCSRNEAFGRVGAEAMRLGKPVIYTATGGMAEYCVDGETGLAYAPGDVAGLVDRLERLIAQPDMRRQMGAKGFARAQAVFSRERFSGEAYRVMKDLRAKRRAAPPRAPST
jgi:glycosyltransferase involved in cell wall biosynthesis